MTKGKSRHISQQANEGCEFAFKPLSSDTGRIWIAIPEVFFLTIFYDFLPRTRQPKISYYGHDYGKKI